MLRRLLTPALGVLVTLVAVAFPVAPAPATALVPDCEPVTFEDSTRAAMAVFSGTVTKRESLPRTDGLPGRIYLQTVTLDLVYQGQIRTETVMVQTDRNRGACSLGALAVDSEYMFFVGGTGDPWVATGLSGTRLNDPTVTAQVEAILGAGDPPIEPPDEHAVFTPVETDDPQALSRAAAPGAALVIVGLLGLVVVGAVRRRL